VKLIAVSRAPRPLQHISFERNVVERSPEQESMANRPESVAADREAYVWAPESASTPYTGSILQLA